MIALLSFALFAATPDSTLEAQRLAHARTALLGYVQPHDATADATHWWFAWADLNGDGLKDAVAYAQDPDWCGTGGCTLLVLEAIPEEDQQEMGPFHVAAEIAMVSPPVRVTDKTAHGWADLTVATASGEPVRLSFTGETYPYSPAEGTPARASAGRVLIAAGE